MGQRGPRSEYENKRETITTRCTPELRERLDQAASRNNRSLSNEIEHRLRRSFDPDKHREFIEQEAGGAESLAVLRLLGMLARGASIHAEKSWLDDPYWFEVTFQGMQMVLEHLRPEGEIRPPTDKVFARLAEYLGPNPKAHAAASALGLLDQIRVSSGNAEDHWPRHNEDGTTTYSADTLKSHGSIKRALGKYAERLK